MYSLKIRNPLTGLWEDMPTIKGKSVYEYAVEGGYTGTEEEFLALLYASVGSLVNSENGAYGLRFYNDKLQYKSGDTWVDIIETWISPQIVVNVDSGSTVTITCGDKVLTGTSVDGSCTFNVSFGTWTCSASNDTETSSSVTVTVSKVIVYTVDLAYVKATLNDNSWEVISAISAKGTASNYWSVGDTKRISVNGTVGTLSLNATYDVFILGFDHNWEKEGKGITFGTFKTTDGIDICLSDSGTSHPNSTNGTKKFNMNHSGNTNSGGWKSSDLRYDILGSVDSKGLQNATSAAITSPVSGTLMAVLPSDLRAVLTPITKYSDNTGGGSDTASYVTATVDYLPLLSEFEVYGARRYANSTEQSYQKQYDYYKNGNSKIKYTHSSTGTARFWWLRSVCSLGAAYFCGVTTSGTATNSSAYIASGLAALFKI